MAESYKQILYEIYQGSAYTPGHTHLYIRTCVGYMGS